jgi:hypothetical protein
MLEVMAMYTIVSVVHVLQIEEKTLAYNTLQCISKTRRCITCYTKGQSLGTIKQTRRYGAFEYYCLF